MFSVIVGTVIGLALANIALGFAAALALRRRWAWLQENAVAESTGLPPHTSLPGVCPSLSAGGNQDQLPPSGETCSVTSGGDVAALVGEEDATPPPASEGRVTVGGAPDAEAQSTDLSFGPPAPAAAGQSLTYGATAPSEEGPPNALQYSASVVRTSPDIVALGPLEGADEPHAIPARWEAGVRALEESSRQYQAQLVAIDQRLQNMPPQNTQEVLAAAASIRDAGQRYLHEQKEAAQGVVGEAIPPDELAALASQIQAALEAQTAQIEASDRSLAALQDTATPEEAHGRCVAESAKLREASGRVGDVLQSALARLSAGKKECAAAPSPDEEPLPAGLIARAALEQKITQWWKDDPEHKRALALAVLEIDLFEQIAGRFGRDVANRLLRAVTGIVLAEGGGHALASRSTGRGFALAFPDADVRLAVHVVERIRQAIERSHFRCHEFDLRVTLSAGITPATPEDNLQSFWQRAESALAEARRYGRNRVFVHEGRYPTPVVPPNLDLPEKSIDL